jgi:hypothetical protein
MALVPISVPPGVALSMSNYSSGKTGAQVQAGDASRVAQGRWTAGSNVEFVAGYPQKIAGWIAATSSLTVGIPRCVKIWRCFAGQARVGIGTETHLYSLSGSVLTDITPLRSIANGTLANAITTTNGSQTVAITDAAQTLVNGDWVYLSAGAAVGGLLINGWYSVSGRSGAGYNITATSAATSSAGPGGGTILYQYPRTTIVDPFTTILDSDIVNVTHVASGAAAGNYVTFANATTVGGLTIDGEYVIVTIVDADNYTIQASSPALASAGPGGGAVSVIYDIQVQQSALSTGITYGSGAYGVGPYGVGIATTPVLANGWTLAPYGSQLLACPIGGTIYVYDTADRVRQGLPSAERAYVHQRHVRDARAVRGRARDHRQPDANGVGRSTGLHGLDHAADQHRERWAHPNRRVILHWRGGCPRWRVADFHRSLRFSDELHWG